MSKNYCFYKVSRIEHRIPKIVHPDFKYQNDDDIYIVELDRASEWMKTIGKQAIVEYIDCDYKKLTLDKFNSDYNRISYVFNGNRDFYLDGKHLGTVSKDECNGYNKLMQYEALLFKRELIYNPDDYYAIYGMKDGLYSEDELFKKIEEIENSDYCDAYEALYILYKCAHLAHLGHLVWCEAC